MIYAKIKNNLEKNSMICLTAYYIFEILTVRKLCI